MSNTHVIALVITIGVYSYLVLRLWQGMPRKTPLAAVVLVALALAFGARMTLEALPYRTIERQPAGALIALQSGHRFNTIVETSQAFYTVRGGFTANKGEVLELWVRQHPVFRMHKSYLCSARGCSVLAGSVNPAFRSKMGDSDIDL